MGSRGRGLGVEGSGLGFMVKWSRIASVMASDLELWPAV